jgi:hypothetical protein
MTIARIRAGAMRRPIAAVVCLAFSGCSFATVQRARPAAEVEDPRVVETCTTARSAPVADSVLAGVGLVGGYFGLLASAGMDCSTTTTSSGTSRSCGNDGGDAVALANLAAMAAGGVFLGSAIYGHATTAQCRRHIAAERRCASGDVWTCDKLSPGWRPPPGWRAPGAVLEPVPGSGPGAAPPPIPPPGNAPPAPPANAPPPPAAPAAPTGADAR